MCSEELDQNQQKCLKNVFESWQICKNNHVFIENVNNDNIKIGKNISINGTNKSLSSKTTLFIENCSDTIIKVVNKFNHLIVNGCNNVHIYLTHGLVSGIDVLNSKNVTCEVKFSSVNYLSCAKSETFVLKMDKLVASKILMLTLDSYKVLFELGKGIDLAKYLTNTSIFPDMTYYVVDKNTYCIHYVNKNGSGVLV